MITGLQLVALHIRHFINTTFLDCGRFIPALSVCDGTNMTMIANNCPPLTETSYSQVHEFSRLLKARSLPLRWPGWNWMVVCWGRRTWTDETTARRGENEPRPGLEYSRGWRITDRAAGQTVLRMSVIFQSMFFKRRKKSWNITGLFRWFIC